MAAFFIAMEPLRIIPDTRRSQRIFLLWSGRFQAVEAVDGKELKAFFPGACQPSVMSFLHGSRTKHFQGEWRKREKGDDLHVRGFR
jgi:hypothetical protein